jgi:hypothetical protein
VTVLKTARLRLRAYWGRGHVTEPARVGGGRTVESRNSAGAVPIDAVRTEHPAGARRFLP